MPFSKATPLSADLLLLIKSFKQNTSWSFKIKNSKTLWQTSFYDHILRGEEAPGDVADYIWANPVRAGLVEKPFDYPYSGPIPQEQKFPLPRARDWTPPAMYAYEIYSRKEKEGWHERPALHPSHKP